MEAVRLITAQSATKIGSVVSPYWSETFFGWQFVDVANEILSNVSCTLMKGHVVYMCKRSLLLPSSVTKASNSTCSEGNLFYP